MAKYGTTSECGRAVVGYDEVSKINFRGLGRETRATWREVKRGPFAAGPGRDAQDRAVRDVRSGRHLPVPVHRVPDENMIIHQRPVREVNTARVRADERAKAALEQARSAQAYRRKIAAGTVMGAAAGGGTVAVLKRISGTNEELHASFNQEKGKFQGHQKKAAVGFAAGGAGGLASMMADAKGNRRLGNRIGAASLAGAGYGVVQGIKGNGSKRNALAYRNEALLRAGEKVSGKKVTLTPLEERALGFNRINKADTRGGTARHDALIGASAGLGANIGMNAKRGKLTTRFSANPRRTALAMGADAAGFGLIGAGVGAARHRNSGVPVVKAERSDRYYDPEDKRQRRVGAAMAASGGAGALLLNQGRKGVRVSPSKKRVIMPTRNLAQLAGGAALIGTGTAIGRYGQSKSNRRWR